MSRRRSFHPLLCLFNDTPATEIYTLSLHDALPISKRTECERNRGPRQSRFWIAGVRARAKSGLDRKSTRLNSSHTVISYAVFCLKKKTNERALGDAADLPVKHRRGPQTAHAGRERR